jgi:hypothetical protein
VDGQEWVEEIEEHLGEIFCLTFVKDVDETEALRRMGGLADTFGARTLEELRGEAESFDAGYPHVATALRVGAWTVVIEPDGFEGSDNHLMAAVSRGTQAVVVQRHNYASHTVGHAVDGELLVYFNSDWPERSWVTPPDHLLAAVREVGLEPGPDGEADIDPPTAGLMFANRVTRVTLTVPMLAEPLPSAHLEPWFATTSIQLLCADTDRELAEAVEAAGPRLQRAVATEEIIRLAAASGASDIPGLSEALTAAAGGNGEPIRDDSALGQRVRRWLADSRRAGNSLNDHWARYRMSDADRDRAFLLGWLAEALRGALSPDPRTAALGALRPLVDGPPPLRDPARRAAVLELLRQVWAAS